MRSVLGLFLALLVAPAVTFGEASVVQRVQQLVDYVGVDYGGAVARGEVANPVEYEEMKEFTRTLVELSKKLPQGADKGSIVEQLTHLSRLVEESADPARVAALAGKVRQTLVSTYGLAVVPERLPDLERGRKLYAERCAACHGVQGKGDGPLAASLDPRPTDFTDLDRYRQRTLYGLYSTITHGVEGTAMRAFSMLPADDRWSLAFYVGRLAPLARLGEKPESAFPAGLAKPSPRELTTLTPAEMEARWGERGAEAAAWLRLHPEAVLAKGTGSALRFTRHKLEESLQAYRRGESKRAHELAVTAYLEGFELVEGNLDAVDGELRHRIEAEMTSYRNAIRRGEPVQTVAGAAKELQELLETAGAALDAGRLSPAAAFTGALVILLREGLEALLVVAALAAFLIKTGRRDGLRYLAVGSGGALLLGLLTWFVSTHLVTIGGEQRELTEGLAGLFAALMLFYVGFWLHSKTSAAQWQAFIQGSVQKALGKGTLWGLSGLAFIAVYREIFETVLFYQALWVQAGGAGRGMILSGFLLAAGLLVALGWALLRYSTRLPLRQFFSATSVFMFVLAVVFAGKGVAALQEAGKLPINLVHFPRIELLGIYPNLEGLSVQAAMVILAALLLWRGSGASRAG